MSDAKVAPAQAPEAPTKMPNATDVINQNRFDDDALKAAVSSSTYAAWGKSMASGTPMPEEANKELATALHAWASERGAVNFSHWFFPMRGMVAGTKHDAFININFGSKNPLKEIMGNVFNDGQLFMSESDGSSYPNGGMRSTHTAAAYMSWDRSSPPYIVGDTMYIPSTFAAWTGAPLDYKTPLLKAQEAVSKAATRMCHHLGMTDVKKVILNLGWEQEYFLTPLEYYNARPDLLQCDTTLFGKLPPRNQQLSDFYFSPPKPRIKAYMEELQVELWKVGICVSVNHNEVAPSQHELSPIFAPVNVAADQNILCGELMKDIAAKHGLAVILHEKPFAGVNGSGKHANWSLETDTGVNLCNPGKTKASQQAFATMNAAVMHGMHNFQEVIRTAVGSNTNDFRLGGHEAPPAIISCYFGPTLGGHMEAIAKGGPLEGYTGKGAPGETDLSYGSRQVLPATTSLEDRNRTAPMPFCGNRFELRALGSAANPSFLMTCLAGVLSDGCDAISDNVERKGMSLRDSVADVVTKNANIMFNGDGYSAEWHTEAQEVRKLKVLPTTVDALDVFNTDTVKKMFEKHKIYKPAEVDAIANIMYERFWSEVQIELDTMVNMINQGLLPACAKDLAVYKDTGLAGKRQDVYSALPQAVDDLQALQLLWPEDAKKAARHAADVVKPAMLAARRVCEQCEELIATEHYPYPTYLDCLFPHHNEAAKGFEGVKLSANESKLAGLPTPSMPVKVTSAPASGGGGGGGCAIM